MAIDFTLSPEVEELRRRVRAFVEEVIAPVAHGIEGSGGGEGLAGPERVSALTGLRKQAEAAGL